MNSCHSGFLIVNRSNYTILWKIFLRNDCFACTSIHINIYTYGNHTHEVSRTIYIKHMHVTCLGTRNHTWKLCLSYSYIYSYIMQWGDFMISCILVRMFGILELVNCLYAYMWTRIGEHSWSLRCIGCP